VKRKFPAAVVAAFLLTPFALAGEKEHVPHIKPNAGWDQMKSLVGRWEGKKKESLSYKLVSKDSALMETIGMEDGSEMISVYHPDGSVVLMTHYCAMGNQPRMRAKVPKGKIDTLAFDFVDATNVEGNDEFVMKSLTITFKDKDHIVQEWTSKVKKGGQEKAVFELSRAK
jgi:hypothetical protein